MYLSNDGRALLGLGMLPIDLRLIRQRVIIRSVTFISVWAWSDGNVVDHGELEVESGTIRWNCDNRGGAAF